MRSPKYSKMRPWNWKGVIRSRRNLVGGLSKLDYNALIFIMLAGMSGLIILLCHIACSRSSGFLPKTPDWDKQRTMWMDRHPNMRPLEGQRPRILMVTGSAPQPCESAVSTHRILQSAKNKLDYCRLHNIQLYYTMGIPDRNPEFSARFSADWWVTLPVIRILMFQYPEVEWMWWVDADAVFTEMSLEPPFADLKDHNLVLFRESPKDKTGIHTGNYLIRNCQWTLDLIRLWESASSKTADYNLSLISPSDPATEEKLQNTFDARKSMVTSLLRANPKDAGHKVKETENWAVVGPHLEDLQVKLQQKQEHVKLPLLTHFAGCMPCSTAPHNHAQLLSTTQQQQQDVCLEQLDRTFDFADNQIYDHYDFQRRALGSSKIESLSKYVTENRAVADASREQFSMLPRISNWDELRRAHLEKSAVAHTKDKVILVSGSPPKPCHQAVGGQMLLRGLKNKIDYCRMHGIEMFHNMADVDTQLTGWWSKLPLVRMLMLKNPDVEWLWWMDIDAMVTDMDFEIPFERYNAHGGYNLVMHGQKNLLYEEKTFTAINAGNFVIRNCQWSIDLLDRWASFATTLEMRDINGKVLSNFLTERPTDWEADDQSVLVYMLSSERERWSSKVLLETQEVDMSANWEYWTPRFVDNVPLSYKPFVTHFAGCTACGNKVDEKCLTQMVRTFNFADNQVLKSCGLCHEHLSSPDIVSSCNIRSRVM